MGAHRGVGALILCLAAAALATGHAVPRQLIHAEEPPAEPPAGPAPPPPPSHHHHHHHHRRRRADGPELPAAGAAADSGVLGPAVGLDGLGDGVPPLLRPVATLSLVATGAAAADDAAEQSAPAASNELWDGYLSHNLDMDMEKRDNHARVMQVAKMLREEHAIKTWLDEEQVGLTSRAQGIERSQAFVVFITRKYMAQLESSEPANVCKQEFAYALRRKGARFMIPVVMEPEMLDVSQWTGLLRATLADVPYFDMAESLHPDFLMDDAHKDLYGPNGIVVPDLVARLAKEMSFWHDRRLRLETPTPTPPPNEGEEEEEEEETMSPSTSPSVSPENLADLCPPYLMGMVPQLMADAPPEVKSICTTTVDCFKSGRTDCDFCLCLRHMPYPMAPQHMAMLQQMGNCRPGPAYKLTLVDTFAICHADPTNTPTPTPRPPPAPSPDPPATVAIVPLKPDSFTPVVLSDTEKALNRQRMCQCATEDAEDPVNTLDVILEEAHIKEVALRVPPGADTGKVQDTLIGMLMPLAGAKPTTSTTRTVQKQPDAETRRAAGLPPARQPSAAAKLGLGQQAAAGDGADGSGGDEEIGGGGQEAPGFEGGPLSVAEAEDGVACACKRVKGGKRVRKVMKAIRCRTSRSSLLVDCEGPPSAPSAPAVNCTAARLGAGCGACERSPGSACHASGGRLGLCGAGRCLSANASSLGHGAGEGVVAAAAAAAEPKGDDVPPPAAREQPFHDKEVEADCSPQYNGIARSHLRFSPAECDELGWPATGEPPRRDDSAGGGRTNWTGPAQNGTGPQAEQRVGAVYALGAGAGVRSICGPMVINMAKQYLPQLMAAKPEAGDYCVGLFDCLGAAKPDCEMCMCLAHFPNPLPIEYAAMAQQMLDCRPGPDYLETIFESLQRCTSEPPPSMSASVSDSASVTPSIPASPSPTASASPPPARRLPPSGSIAPMSPSESPLPPHVPPRGSRVLISPSATPSVTPSIVAPPNVCRSAQVPACHPQAPLLAARRLCGSLGARLCTLPELRSLRAEPRCPSDLVPPHIWSSTRCTPVEGHQEVEAAAAPVPLNGTRPEPPAAAAAVPGRGLYARAAGVGTAAESIRCVPEDDALSRNSVHCCGDVLPGSGAWEDSHCAYTESELHVDLRPNAGNRTGGARRPAMAGQGYFVPLGLPARKEPDRLALRFSIRGGGLRGETRLLLTGPGDAGPEQVAFEILLCGGAGRNVTEVRAGATGTVVIRGSSRICAVSPAVFRRFWLDYDGHSLRVGRGGIGGPGVLVSVFHRRKVTGVAVGASAGTQVRWRDICLMHQTPILIIPPLQQGPAVTAQASTAPVCNVRSLLALPLLMRRFGSSAKAAAACRAASDCALRSLAAPAGAEAGPGECDFCACLKPLPHPLPPGQAHLTQRLGCRPTAGANETLLGTLSKCGGRCAVVECPAPLPGTCTKLSCDPATGTCGRTENRPDGQTCALPVARTLPAWADRPAAPRPARTNHSSNVTAGSILQYWRTLQPSASPSPSSSPVVCPDKPVLLQQLRDMESCDDFESKRRECSTSIVDALAEDVAWLPPDASGFKSLQVLNHTDHYFNYSTCVRAVFDAIMLDELPSQTYAKGSEFWQIQSKPNWVFDNRFIHFYAYRDCWLHYVDLSNPQPSILHPQKNWPSTWNQPPYDFESKTYGLWSPFMAARPELEPGKAESLYQKQLRCMASDPKGSQGPTPNNVCRSPSAADDASAPTFLGTGILKDEPECADFVGCVDQMRQLLVSGGASSAGASAGFGERLSYFVGLGFCREKDCHSCSHPWDTQATCEADRRHCQERCEMSVGGRTCSGYAFAEEPAADDDGCRSRGLGRCIIYRGGGQARGTQQAGDRQEYNCFALSRPSNSSGRLEAIADKMYESCATDYACSCLTYKRVEHVKSFMCTPAKGVKETLYQSHLRCAGKPFTYSGAAYVLPDPPDRIRKQTMDWRITCDQLLGGQNRVENLLMRLSNLGGDGQAVCRKAINCADRKGYCDEDCDLCACMARMPHAEEVEAMAAATLNCYFEDHARCNETALQLYQRCNPRADELEGDEGVLDDGGLGEMHETEGACNAGACIPYNALCDGRADGQPCVVAGKPPVDGVCLDEVCVLVDCAGVPAGAAEVHPVCGCGAEPDACGVCGGPGPVQECGCQPLPMGYCDCEMVRRVPNGDCDCGGGKIDKCGVCQGDGSACAPPCHDKADGAVCEIRAQPWGWVLRPDGRAEKRGNSSARAGNSSGGSAADLVVPVNGTDADLLVGMLTPRAAGNALALAPARADAGLTGVTALQVAAATSYVPDLCKYDRKAKAYIKHGYKAMQAPLKSGKPNPLYLKGELSADDYAVVKMTFKCMYQGRNYRTTDRSLVADCDIVRMVTILRFGDGSTPNIRSFNKFFFETKRPFERCKGWWSETKSIQDLHGMVSPSPSPSASPSFVRRFKLCHGKVPDPSGGADKETPTMEQARLAVADTLQTGLESELSPADYATVKATWWCIYRGTNVAEDGSVDAGCDTLTTMRILATGQTDGSKPRVRSFNEKFFEKTALFGTCKGWDSEILPVLELFINGASASASLTPSRSPSPTPSMTLVPKYKTCFGKIENPDRPGTFTLSAETEFVKLALVQLQSKIYRGSPNKVYLGEELSPADFVVVKATWECIYNGKTVFKDPITQVTKTHLDCDTCRMMSILDAYRQRDDAPNVKHFTDYFIDGSNVLLHTCKGWASERYSILGLWADVPGCNAALYYDAYAVTASASPSTSVTASTSVSASVTASISTSPSASPSPHPACDDATLDRLVGVLATLGAHGAGPCQSAVDCIRRGGGDCDVCGCMRTVPHIQEVDDIVWITMNCLYGAEDETLLDVYRVCSPSAAPFAPPQLPSPSPSAARPGVCSKHACVALDCLGVPGGSAVMHPVCGCAVVPDVCGVCGGGGMPKGACECDGRRYDACGVCGGNNGTCLPLDDGASMRSGRQGCMLAEAENFDPLAVSDDGSCRMPMCDLGTLGPRSPAEGRRRPYGRPAAATAAASRRLTASPRRIFQSLLQLEGGSTAGDADTDSDSDADAVVTASAAVSETPHPSTPPTSAGDETDGDDENDDDSDDNQADAANTTALPSPLPLSPAPRTCPPGAGNALIEYLLQRSSNKSACMPLARCLHNNESITCDVCPCIRTAPQPDQTRAELAKRFDCLIRASDQRTVLETFDRRCNVSANRSSASLPLNNARPDVGNASVAGPTAERTNDTDTADWTNDTNTALRTDDTADTDIAEDDDDLVAGEARSINLCSAERIDRIAAALGQLDLLDKRACDVAINCTKQGRMYCPFCDCLKQLPYPMSTSAGRLFSPSINAMLSCRPSHVEQDTLMHTYHRCAGDLCAGVVCRANDQCSQPGVCDPATGTCGPQTKLPDQCGCDDGRSWCSDGECVGLDVVVKAPRVITGCTNPAASNFDAVAVTDDGSCVVDECADLPAERLVQGSPNAKLCSHGLLRILVEQVPNVTLRADCRMALQCAKEGRQDCTFCRCLRGMPYPLPARLREYKADLECRPTQSDMETIIQMHGRCAAKSPCGALRCKTSDNPCMQAGICDATTATCSAQVPKPCGCGCAMPDGSAGWCQLGNCTSLSTDVDADPTCTVPSSWWVGLSSPRNSAADRLDMAVEETLLDVELMVTPHAMAAKPRLDEVSAMLEAAVDGTVDAVNSLRQEAGRMTGTVLDRAIVAAEEAAVAVMGARGPVETLVNTNVLDRAMQALQGAAVVVDEAAVGRMAMGIYDGLVEAERTFVRTASQAVYTIDAAQKAGLREKRSLANEMAATLAAFWPSPRAPRVSLHADGAVRARPAHGPTAAAAVAASPPDVPGRDALPPNIVVATQGSDMVVPAGAFPPPETDIEAHTTGTHQKASPRQPPAPVPQPQLATESVPRESTGEADEGMAAPAEIDMNE